MAKITKTIRKAEKDMEQLEPSIIDGERINLYNSFGKLFGSPNIYPQKEMLIFTKCHIQEFS